MNDPFDMPPTNTSLSPDDRGGEGPGDASARQARPIIVKGRLEPLANVPFHRDGPLTRWLMASAALHPDLQCHIAIHQFSNAETALRDYCDLHVHEYDEYDVFHTTSALRVAVRLGDETVQVDAPATVFVPAGTPHALNVVSGSGFMIAFLMDGRFRAVRGGE